MKPVILFDLGNTLVRYYRRSEFAGILGRSIAAVADVLSEAGLPVAAGEELGRRADAERYESIDHAVRPLEGRLGRVFGFDPARVEAELVDRAARAFLAETFALAHRYEDVVPVLSKLKERRVRTAIISNTPWGSPARLWREELGRHGLTDLVDRAVFCGEVGYRKPHPAIFHYALERLGVGPEACLFVGDDPRWDVAGPQAVGIEAVLIDRLGEWPEADAPRIRTLEALLDQSSRGSEG